MSSKIPTRKDSTLTSDHRKTGKGRRESVGGLCNSHNKISNGIENKLSSSFNNKTFSAGRSSNSTVLRDFNVRSSSLEPCDHRGEDHKPLKMLKSYDDIMCCEDNDTSRSRDGAEEERSLLKDLVQVIKKLLKDTSYTVQDFLQLLSSSTSSTVLLLKEKKGDEGESISLINLWIENILLKGQLSLQQEEGSKPVSSLLPPPPSPSPPSNKDTTTRLTDLPSAHSPSTPSPSSSTAVMEPVTVISSTVQYNNPKEPPHNNDSTSSVYIYVDKDTQTELPPSPLSSDQSTQTDKLPSLLTTTAPVNIMIDQSIQTETLSDGPPLLSMDSSSHLQQRLEAVTISKELLESSLEGAKRSISTLENTVAEQRRDLSNKETQLTTISNRVATLMKSFESTQSDSLQYKTLYYRSLQQCTALQEQLDEMNGLFNKLETLLKLQAKVSGQLTRNGSQIDKWSCDLVTWETNYIQMKHQLILLQSNQDSLQKDYQYLSEANSSLQSSVTDFQQQLAKQLSNCVISNVKEQLRIEEITTLEELISRQKVESKELHGKIAQLVDTFQRSQREFDETTEFAEIERQTLLEANKELESDIKQLKTELQKGEDEFKKLVAYTKDYQNKSTKKTEQLKFNVNKADNEIEELDKLLEHTRKVLHDNMSVVSQCGPLMDLLKELDGDI